MENVFNRIKAYYQKLLPEMTEAEWEHLQSYFTVRHVKKNEFIIKQGKVEKYVYYLNKGLARSFYEFEGKEVCVSFFSEDEYGSEYVGFLTHTPSMYYIQALEDCELIELNYENMQKVYKLIPVFERFGRFIAENLFLFLAKRSTSFLLQDAETRYKEFLQADRNNIVQRIPQYMIASYLGVTPEALSRIRKRISIKK